MSKESFPAFPLFVDWTNKANLREIKINEGMTLRDYFAAKALQGMLCNGFMPHSFYKGPYSPDQPYPFERVAFMIADKMLEARSK